MAKSLITGQIKRFMLLSFSYIVQPGRTLFPSPKLSFILVYIHLLCLCSPNWQSYWLHGVQFLSLVNVWACSIAHDDPQMEPRPKFHVTGWQWDRIGLEIGEAIDEWENVLGRTSESQILASPENSITGKRGQIKQQIIWAFPNKDLLLTPHLSPTLSVLLRPEVTL